jgi:hypothetical protein
MHKYPSFPACLFGWWMMAGADLFGDKSTGGWFVLREKYCSLVADKPSEQGVHLHVYYARSTRVHVHTYASMHPFVNCIYLLVSSF